MSQLFVKQWFFLKKLILLNVICVGWVLSIMFYCLRSRSILKMHASFYRFLENRFFGSWRSLDLVLTLTLGWKNEKQPSGPIELDLEAGNLVCSNVAPLQSTMQCSGCWSVCKSYHLQLWSQHKLNLLLVSCQGSRPDTKRY